MRYLNLYSPSRWEPSLFGNFDRLFTDMLEPINNSAPYEVTETDAAYLLSLDAPGLKKEDVKIEVNGNSLHISGESRREYRDDGKAVSGRSHRQFSRSFTLPDSIDNSRIEANLEDGVLQIAIPKSEAAKPRKIEIAASSGKDGFFTKFLGPKKDTVEVTKGDKA